MEFMGLIHGKSIELWWEPYIWVLFWLLTAMFSEDCLIFVLLFDMHVIISYLS